MKKLIAISVVFALIAGTAFAVDVTGTVFGHVNVLEGSTQDGSDVLASGNMDRIRIDGSGEAGDGVFGGYIRLQDIDASFDNAALAWWKPIDQFKLTIGGNSDGMFGKEGVTGWMFNQMPYDSGIAMGGGDIWGGGMFWPVRFRYAFFGGFADKGAIMEITPMDMLGINIAIPFISKTGEKAEDVFKATIAQLSLNLDFGNIAVTYNGGDEAGAIFAYFGGSFGDLGIDFGLGYHLTGDDDVAQPIGIGLGVKYATDAFGVKLRTTVGIPMEDGQEMDVLVDLLPYFAISDNLAAFVNIGVGLGMPDGGDSITKWFFNPYLRVGAEWGPTFYFGVKVSSSDGGNEVIDFAVPISLMVSF